MEFKAYLPLTTLLLLSFTTFAQKNDEPLSIAAPVDKPLNIANMAALHKMDSTIAPAVTQAHKTLSTAENRFRAGLKQGEAFFLTIRLYDTLGNFEQVFIRVKYWEEDQVSGTIANELETVKGFHNGEMVNFNEKAILDWTISKKDGSEEGNYVGKVLDEKK